MVIEGCWRAVNVPQHQCRTPQQDLQFMARHIRDPVSGGFKLTDEAIAAGGHGAKPIIASMMMTSSRTTVAAQRHAELSNHHLRQSIPKPSQSRGNDFIFRRCSQALTPSRLWQCRLERCRTQPDTVGKIKLLILLV